MRSTLLALMILTLGAGCWEGRVKHLSNAEFDHYYALRPFMSEEQREAFLKLKTEEERNQYLKDQGLWDRFYKYTDEERQTILEGKVAPGWTKEMVYMAWGAPHDRQKLVGRSTHLAERLIYRFEEQPDGSILVWEPNSKTEHSAVRLFIQAVELENDKVVAVTQKDGWSF